MTILTIMLWWTVGKKDLPRAKKEEKKGNANLSFFITAQKPVCNVEERKRLYEISDSMGKRNIRCLIERDRVIMPNGQHYLYPVAKLEISDTPQISQEEIEAFDLSLNIVYTESTIIKDSEIFATGRKIHSVKEAKELYRKISIDPSSAVSNHRILLYRFFYSSSKLLA